MNKLTRIGFVRNDIETLAKYGSTITNMTEKFSCRKVSDVQEYSINYYERTKHTLYK